MYNMVTIVKNPVSYIWKLRGVNLNHHMIQQVDHHMIHF